MKQTQETATVRVEVGGSVFYRVFHGKNLTKDSVIKRLHIAEALGIEPDFNVHDATTISIEIEKEGA